MNIRYRFFSGRYPLNNHANIGCFFFWCRNRLMVEWNYLVQLFFFRKFYSGYCCFWHSLSINFGKDCLANQPLLFLLTTSSACGWCRSNFILDKNYSLSNPIYALVSKGNLGQYCEYLSQHIVFSCQPQL